MISLKNILIKPKRTLNECIITHSVLGNKVLLAKNRDRAYDAKVKVVRELIGEVELVYILDDETDWSEGMNSAGIGILNSALMVNADEKEKKIIKHKGKVSEDGLKIRKALSYPTIAKSVQSIIKFFGKDKLDIGVKGHTFIANPQSSVSIEMTSKHSPVISKMDRSKNHVRTNHGYEYKDSGYTSGANKKSSESRWNIAHAVLTKAKTPLDILDGLSGYYPVNMRDNPYRDKDKVQNATPKDVLSTSSQILLNLTDLEITVRMDEEKSDYLGIIDRTPDWYEPKIKILVEYIKNKKMDIKK
jgi:hypothetical protein|tara:strand:- start:526 stop:1431 length:906 start_codon:yes stop_codon:yes gene_type:complete